MLIFGNHGKLQVDNSSGRVITYDPEGSQEYTNIARFDLQEWRAHYGQVACDGGDILDFGYWLHDETYEPPEADWRAAWREVLRDNG